jgi:hypothetical protein
MNMSGRPRTVLAFEIVAIAEVCITFALEPDFSLAGLGPTLLSLFLIVCITRLRSRAARWIYSIFTVLALIAVPYWVANGMIAEMTTATWIFLVLAPVQLGLLWAPATSRWMAPAPQTGEEQAAVSVE